jgi:hypothetical protein
MAEIRTDDAQTEYLRGGKGRIDEIGKSGIYPSSYPDAPGDSEIRTEGELVRHSIGSSTSRKTRRARSLVLSPRLFGFVVGTRAVLGFGLGLLLGDRIPRSRRKALGLTLVAIGAVTTIPAAVAVFGRRTPRWSLNTNTRG